MKKIGSVLGVLLLSATVVYAGGEDGSQHITHHMMMLMIQLGVIIFAAHFGGLLFLRLRMPSVLGELFAGMLIGPYLLGSIHIPGMLNGLFPLHEGFPLSYELYGICSLAAIVLLFLVGLESDLKLFLRFSMAGTAVGIGGVLASFVLGDVTMMLAGPWLFGRELGFFDGSCLFLGVVSTATSVGITARVLSEKKKLSSPEGVTILAGAVIDDVLGIIALAIVLGALSATGSSGTIDWVSIGIIAGKAVGIWLISTVLGLMFARRISVLLKWFKDPVAIAVMALGLALILAGLFETAGLAMIIGAYVAGLSLSQTDISRVVQEKLEPVNKLLVPVFFCCMGMLVDFSVLNSVKLLVFGLIYSVVAVLAKVIGCSIPALFFNFNMRGALRVGMGMVPRGEVALIIAGIGLAWGVLGPQEFGVAIMMTVLTTLLAPILLVKLFSNPASGTVKEVETQERSTYIFNFPSVEITELLFGKLLTAFGHDGFFVHALDHDGQDIYQLRQHDMVIELRCSECNVFFECEKQDEHIVNSAVFEVVTDMKKMLEGLKEPIDQGQIQQKIQQSARGTSRKGLNLSQYISLDCVQPALKADNKDDVIEELLDMLVARGVVAQKAPVLEALREREKIISTGLQHGFAMPHVKTDYVNRIVCAVGVRQQGIDFDALDGEPSRIFVMELAPEHEAGPHLQFVSSISQAVEANIEHLLAGNLDAKEIHRLLTDW